MDWATIVCLVLVCLWLLILFIGTPVRKSTIKIKRVKKTKDTKNLSDYKYTYKNVITKEGKYP